MEQQKQPRESDIVKVRFTGMTYKAKLDGESTTCTAGPEMAAKRLAANVLDVPFDQVALKELPFDNKKDEYRFLISNLN